MARHMQIPFQFDKPVFVKIPFQSRGRVWSIDQHFKWKEMNIDRHRVRVLFQQGYLYHDDDMEEAVNQTKIGDGLNELDIESLHALVDKINEKVKASVKNETEWKRKKCPSSKIKDKQIGLIRRWRNLYGQIETI